MMKRRNPARGFSLLELLLALAVFATLMMAIFTLLQSYAEKELARSTNKYMTNLAKAMTQILSNVDNFNALYLAARDSAGGGYQLIADASAPAVDNIAKNFRVGTIWIQGSRLLNDNITQNTPMHTTAKILLRVADTDPMSDADGRALEVLIVTSDPRSITVVHRAASEAGPAGGYIDTYAAKASARVRHSYGSWSVDLSSRLQGTSWYQSSLRGSLNSQTDGSYLVNYTYFTLADQVGDYLYRMPDPDPSAKLNTMYGPLNLGGNNIIGADDINIGNSGSAAVFTSSVASPCQGGVLCVNGTGIIKGAASVGRTMQLSGSALIADSMTATTMRLQNGLSAADKTNYAAQNQFVVDGRGNDGGGNQDEINISGVGTFNDGVTATTGSLGEITANTMTIPDPGILTTGTISNTRRLSSTTSSGNSLYVDHQLKAGIVANGPVNVTGGRIGALDVKNSQNLFYGTAASPRTLTPSKTNLKSLSISNFGSCSTGCGQ